MLKVMQKKERNEIHGKQRFNNLFALLLRCMDKLKECLWLLIINQTFFNDYCVRFKCRSINSHRSAIDYYRIHLNSSLNFFTNKRNIVFTVMHLR